MPRSLFCALGILGLVLAGCHGGGDSDGGTSGTTGVDSGTYVVPVDDLDAGNGLRQPAIADTLGPFSGEFDVNGAGELFALQVDGHLALVINDPSQSYLGTADAGHFKTEIAYPDLETCAPETFDGSYADGGYSGTQAFCANGELASGPLVGVRFIGAQLYRQDLAWSGAYDATEIADPSNTCARVTGSHKLVFGVARDLDGGAVTAALFGDGLKPAAGLRRRRFHLGPAQRPGAGLLGQRHRQLPALLPGRRRHRRHP